MRHLKAPDNDSKERIALDLMTIIGENDCVTSPDAAPMVKVRDAAYWLDLYAQCLSSVRRSKTKPS